MAPNSSHLRNRSVSASGNSLGTQEIIKVPIPGSASQNLLAILYSTCICIQKSELRRTLAILDVQDPHGKELGPKLSVRLTGASSRVRRGSSCSQFVVPEKEPRNKIFKVPGRLSNEETNVYGAPTSLQLNHIACGI